MTHFAAISSILLILNNSPTLPGKALRHLRGHREAVFALAFTPDCTHLMSACFDRSIVICDSATGKKVRTLHGHDARVLALACCADGRRLASADADGNVLVWRLDREETPLRLQAHAG